MTQTDIAKFERWFETLSKNFDSFNKKFDKFSQDVRSEFSDFREFIEQQQNDIRLCKISIRHHDDQIEKLNHRIQKVEKNTNH